MRAWKWMSPRSCDANSEIRSKHDAMFNQLKNLFRTNAYATPAAILLAIAVLGWAAGVSTYLRSTDDQPASSRLTMPEWAPFLAGDERGIAMEIESFATNPDDKPATPIADPEAAATAAVESKPDADAENAWRFLGTYERRGETFAVIVVGKAKQLQLVGRDGRLPNGEQLAEIAADRIGYVNAEGNKVVRLFERVQK